MIRPASPAAPDQTAIADVSPEEMFRDMRGTMLAGWVMLGAVLLAGLAGAMHWPWWL
jgi:hypothetical protein